ncbi:MAG: caspase domain-containing protein [Spirulina sp.]
MSSLNRRRFLLFASSALAAIGFNAFTSQQHAAPHARVLARSTPRKLALLVGINAYHSQALDGCLNDIDLQRTLLIHRFGFNPRDIQVVADAAATRAGILTAFEEHLIKQAKPGDVVMYHYSGHGSRIFDPHPIVVEPDGEGLNGTFVPVDSDLPPGYPEVGGTVQDIMGHTLFLLMSALRTENVTVVLDSCFSGGAIRQGKVRSRHGGKNILVSNNEHDYQQHWLSRLQMSPEAFVRGYRAGVAKGVVLAATAPNQLARELNINGFYSGLFSYLLTYYLWQENSHFADIFPKILAEIPQKFKQTPNYEVAVGSRDRRQSPYFIETPNSPARAVVIKVQGNTAELWLGGVDLREVEAGTVFAGVNGRGRVTVLSRDGLVAEATIQQRVREGTPLQLLDD